MVDANEFPDPSSPEKPNITCNLSQTSFAGQKIDKGIKSTFTDLDKKFNSVSDARENILSCKIWILKPFVYKTGTVKHLTRSKKIRISPIDIV
ncbi:MAG: hypothetical protein ACJ72Z_09165 [Pyrinomonadaceae bacterium]